MSWPSSGYKVRDILIDNEFTTIDPGATVADAAQKMKETGVPDLIILDGEKNTILGVIADFNIVQHIVAEGKDPSAENVRTAMFTIEPVTLDTPVEEAFARMEDLKVSVVPVVDEGELHGLCTIQECWSYIPPPKGTSRVGLIPVKNVRLTQLWLSCVCAIAAFLLGIVFPLIGTFGYFTGTTSQLLNLFPTANVQGGAITFYLFDAHNTLFTMNYFALAQAAGIAWVLILILGFAVLMTSIIGVVSLVYSSFVALKGFATEKFHQWASPLTAVIFLAAEWIFLGITLAIVAPTAVFQVDPVGLTCSVAAACLIMLAVVRDNLFGQKVGGE